MPVITEVLGAIWRVAHDLSGLFTAKTYEVTYTKVTAGKTWDETQYRDIGLYSGQANPDLIRIKAEFDGIDADVMVGVVDRNAREQTDEGVVGRLSGRDKAALVLDRYHPTAYTLQGITVVNNAPVAGLTYRQAVSDVATKAGLTAVFNVGTDDYNLGRTIAVTTDQTYGEIIAQLMEPWRFGERFSHDAFVSDDGLTLTIIRRGLLGDRAVNFERLTVDEYTKRVLPAVNDVRVEGTAFETVVANTLFTLCDPLTPLVETKDFNASSPEESYVETLKTFRDVTCQPIRTERETRYKDNLRTVTVVTTMEYFSAPGTPIDKLPRRMVIERRETNGQAGKAVTRRCKGADLPGQGPCSFNGQDAIYTNATHSYTNVLRESQVVEYEYYGDNGDTRREDLEIRKFEVPVPAGGENAWPAATNSLVIIETWLESSRTLRQYVYVRGIGHGQRQTTTRHYKVHNDGGLEAITEETQPEVAGFPVGTATQPVVKQGFSQVTAQISAGPATAKRREQSDMIGDNVSAELIRQRLITENAAVVTEATFRMTPDHSMKPGKNLVVLGAPVWFDVTSFFVVASEISADDRGAVQTLQCLAWTP